MISPLIGNGQADYDMQICRFHHWESVRRLRPLIEYRFRRHGLTRFRIVGIEPPTMTGAPSERISAVSFTDTGVFSGSITTLTPPVGAESCTSE